MSKLTELEQVIGYEFNEQRLLQQALTHSSFANEKHMKKLCQIALREICMLLVEELTRHDL